MFMSIKKDYAMENANFVKDWKFQNLLKDRNLDKVVQK